MIFFACVFILAIVGIAWRVVSTRERRRAQEIAAMEQFIRRSYERSGKIKQGGANQ